MPLFEVSPDGLIPFRQLESGAGGYDEVIEDVLWHHLDALVGERLFRVRRQAPLDGGGRPAVVALDADGSVVVIHVRRQMDRSGIAECLEYAGWARAATLDELAMLYWRGDSDFWTDWHSFVGGTSRPVKPAPRILLATGDFTARAQSTFEFLVENGLPVKVMRATMYQEAGGRRIIDVDAPSDVESVLKPSPAAEATFERLSRSARRSAERSAERSLPEIAPPPLGVEATQIIGQAPLRPPSIEGRVLEPPYVQNVEPPVGRAAGRELQRGANQPAEPPRAARHDEPPGRAASRAAGRSGDIGHARPADFSPVRPDDLGPARPAEFSQVRADDHGQNRPSDFGRARPDDFGLPRTPDRRNADPRSADPRHVEPRSAEPRTAEPRSADPRTADRRTAEPRSAEPRTAEPRNADPRHVEPRAADPRTADPRNAEPRSADPRHVEPRNADPRNAEPRNAEPRSADPRHVEPRNEHGRRELERAPERPTADRPLDRSADRPVDRSADRPIDRSADRSLELPMRRSNPDPLQDPLSGGLLPPPTPLTAEQLRTDPLGMDEIVAGQLADAEKQGDPLGRTDQHPLLPPSPPPPAEPQYRRQNGRGTQPTQPMNPPQQPGAPAPPASGFGRTQPEPFEAPQPESDQRSQPPRRGGQFPPLSVVPPMPDPSADADQQLPDLPPVDAPDPGDDRPERTRLSDIMDPRMLRVPDGFAWGDPRSTNGKHENGHRDGNNR